MLAEGPDLRELTRHLAECPPIFLEEPVQPSGLGGVHVHAVLSDLLADLGGSRLSEAESASFRYTGKGTVREERNRLRLALVGGWLLSHPGLKSTDSALKARQWLAQGLSPLAGLVAVESLVSDSDRREEFVRLGLSALGLRPAGESAAQAQNRLSALSSVERDRVVSEARAAQERAQRVREEMLAKQRAEAAASSYSNE